MGKQQIYPMAVEIQLYAALLLKFFDQALQLRLRAHGARISGLQHGILRMLQKETVTVSEISQRFGLDPSTVVRAVDSLEAKGLAVRGRDPHDRRRNPITITDQGKALIAAIPAIAPEDPTFQALQSLGATSTARLRDLLRELVQQVPEGKLVAGLMTGEMS
jgi:DNA-binding MarR family transcriptional regulator